MLLRECGVHVAGNFTSQRQGNAEEGHSSPSRYKVLRGHCQTQRDRRRTLDTMCMCREMWGGKQANSLRESKLGPSNESGIRVAQWGQYSGPRPPQNPENGQIYCILIIHIVLCHVSKNTLLLVRHNGHLFLFLLWVLHCTVLLQKVIFVAIYYFHSTFRQKLLLLHNRTYLWCRIAQ